MRDLEFHSTEDLIAEIVNRSERIILCYLPHGRKEHEKCVFYGSVYRLMDMLDRAWDTVVPDAE